MINSGDRTFIAMLIFVTLTGCEGSVERPRTRTHQITVTSVEQKAVTQTQRFVCQIRSHHYIDVRAPVAGYLSAILIKDGQSVRQDDLLFEIKTPTNQVSVLGEGNVISIKAPFDGVINNRLSQQQGSLIQVGDTMATLCDNTQMQAYFSVPESRYLEFMSSSDPRQQSAQIRLELANGKLFSQPGKLGAIAADFNSETGCIQFRADFPNPERLLRHGQIGNVLVSQLQNDAIVVPQRATFELLNKRYVYLVDLQDVVHRREIVVQSELDDLFVIKAGVDVNDTIVLDGIRYIADGEKVQYEHPRSKKVASNLN